MTERTSIRSLTCFMFVPIVNVYIFVVIFIIVNRGYGEGYIERSTTGRNVIFYGCTLCMNHLTKTRPLVCSGSQK